MEITMIQEVYAISVLVRVFNSEKTLPRLLSALDLQDGDEVVAVDSSSTDGTLAVAEKLGARIFHAPPPFNYSKSLNVGFRAARNPWVLVISSHAVPLVPNLLEIFRAAAITFPPDVVVGYGTNLVDFRQVPEDSKVTIFDRADLAATILSCGNANALYRRTAWEEYPFDETIRTAEDHLWLTNRVGHGCRFAKVPAARTLNRTAYSLRYMFRKGYSDASAGTDAPMTITGLFLNFASHTKRMIRHGMLVGNWARLVAHGVGSFFGSRAERGNRHW
jgi:glycosyltransferase involved in cell wall biosynthesis